MKSFFSEKVLKEILKSENDPQNINNFIDQDDCDELLEFRKSIKSKMVDREESTKVAFNFEQSDISKKLKKKVEEKIGEFYVNDFEPHFVTTRFPLRLHVDTGKNPNDIIFKNVVIPLEVVYQNENENKKKPNTIIFKNKWYDRSALFTKKTSDNYDFIIKNSTGNFVDITNIHDFKKKIDEVEDKEIVYEGNKFFVNKNFKDYITMLSKTKRYNIRTDKHIINKTNFDKNIYEKYMSHQPYEDCQGLELDKALEWNVGSLIYWDRIRIHSSDNFLKNNIFSKTAIALFTSKTRTT